MDAARLASLAGVYAQDVAASSVQRLKRNADELPVGVIGDPEGPEGDHGVATGELLAQADGINHLVLAIDSNETAGSIPSRKPLSRRDRYPELIVDKDGGTGPCPHAQDGHRFVRTCVDAKERDPLAVREPDVGLA